MEEAVRVYLIRFIADLPLRRSENTAHFVHKMIFSTSVFSLPYTHPKFERLEALLKGQACCLKAAT